METAVDQKAAERLGLAAIIERVGCEVVIAQGAHGLKDGMCKERTPVESGDPGIGQQGLRQPKAEHPMGLGLRPVLETSIRDAGRDGFEHRNDTVERAFDPLLIGPQPLVLVQAGERMRLGPSTPAHLRRLRLDLHTRTVGPGGRTDAPA